MAKEIERKFLVDKEKFEEVKKEIEKDWENWFYIDQGYLISNEKGIARINALQADLVLFTGDLVNNFASETDGWLPVLSKIKAKHGVFAILGNHDYGDYVRFERFGWKGP